MLRRWLVVFAAMGMLAAGQGNSVTRLSRQLERGEVKLDYRDDKLGYLPSLLQGLHVPVDSQVLVFGKNSLQAAKISPANPRALYYNDDVSVGFVPGGEVLELAAVDPVDGVIFYTLDTHRSEKPKFERRTGACGSCHGNNQLVLNSSIPQADGTPLILLGAVEPIPVTHRTPFEERWGGWYVTGTHGSQRHRGNAVASDPFKPLDLDTENTQNITRLDGRFDLSKYLLPSSDIVSLMVMEHQMQMTNLINRVMRVPSDMNIGELVDYMLFVDEAPLKEEVRGVSTFTATFPQQGPRDSRGRSFRDFDLKTRLFRYPLSYMIYSDQFDQIPAAVKEKVYTRLVQVLRERVAPEDRSAILGILRETKAEALAHWEP